MFLTLGFVNGIGQGVRGVPFCEQVDDVFEVLAPQPRHV